MISVFLACLCIHACVFLDMDAQNVYLPAMEDQNMSCNISVYNVAGCKEKFQSKIKDLGGTVNARGDQEPIQVSFDSWETALIGVNSLHGKTWNGNKILAFLKPMAPDVEKGHHPNLLVFTEVPDDVSVLQLWEVLDQSKGIKCLEFMPSEKRNVLVYTESDEDAREILEKAPLYVGRHTLNLVSWFDYCFEMMTKKVLKLSGLPADCDESKIKEFCGYENEIAYVNYVPEKEHAFVFFESAYPVDMLLKKKKSELSDSTVEIKRFRHSDFLQNIVFVFVNNLPKSVESSDIRELFATCGDVLKAAFSEDKQTGRKRAVVYFNEKEEAERALQLDGYEFLDEIIEVQSNCRKKEVFAVYVTNLHRGTRPIDLCYIFQDCGHIVNVIVPNQQKIVHKGEPAVVYFAKPSSVILALNKHKKAKIRGIRIFVSEERPSGEEGGKPIINRSKMYQRMPYKKRRQFQGNGDYKRQRVED